MKIVIYLIIYLLLNSCTNSNYYGYVYDADKKKPLEGVRVYDLDNEKEVKTNEKGYFELNYTKNISSTLIFQKQYYHDDTISSISIQSGELMEERFKGERIYLFNVSSTLRDSIFKLNQVK